jgi:uroporphyrinogen-III synthase
MSRPRPPVVVLLSARGTLRSIDPLLRRAGVRLVRITLLTSRPVAPPRWLERLRRTERPDTVVLTSRAAIGAGLMPWVRAVGRLPPSLEIWAVGPGTALALRRAGFPRIHTPSTAGSLAVVRALRRRRPRSVVYLRSDLAGTRVARALRKEGHEVLDVVVYRTTAAGPRAIRRARELSGADALVATSPSALASLRRGVDRRLFLRLARTVPTVVLGPRTQRSARGHGFRHVSVAPSTVPQRFTQHLLGVLDRADR